MADAIREKKKTDDALSFPIGFVNAIESINGDGGDSGNEFVVTIIYDDDSETFIPNCTYSEIEDACNNGKSISVVGEPEMFDYCNEGIYGRYNAETQSLEYTVIYYASEADSHKKLVRRHVFTADGVDVFAEDDMYQPQDANAVPSDVASGKVFYYINGRAVGTGAMAGIELEQLSVSNNGIYTPPSGHAYSEVTVDVACGDNSAVESGIIDKTISVDYFNSSVKYVGSYAFFNCSSLKAADFPACSMIGASAFSSCTSLSRANFPVCTSIYTYAFCRCFNLSSINFPKCRTIGNTAFSNCSKLTTISFQECGTIGNYAFLSCINLTKISFPACISIGSYAFSGCSRLSEAYFPMCNAIASDAFGFCSGLTAISFPACTILNGTNNFRSCRTLLSAYFLGSSVPSLGNSNAFINTPIDGFTSYTNGVLGSIYVRASLLTSFRSATNWSYYYSRFVGLTDEEIEALDGTVEVEPPIEEPEHS